MVGGCLGSGVCGFARFFVFGCIVFGVVVHRLVVLGGVGIGGRFFGGCLCCPTRDVWVFGLLVGWRFVFGVVLLWCCCRPLVCWGCICIVSSASRCWFVLVRWVLVWVVGSVCVCVGFLSRVCLVGLCCRLLLCGCCRWFCR